MGIRHAKAYTLLGRPSTKLEQRSRDDYKKPEFELEESKMELNGSFRELYRVEISLLWWVLVRQKVGDVICVRVIGRGDMEVFPVVATAKVEGSLWCSWRRPLPYTPWDGDVA
ncbi:hypothetical protein Tco_0247747 [Tanacetum coccineum]